MFSVDKCLEFIGELGDMENEIIIKTDQQNSIGHLVGEIAKGRPNGRTIVEESPIQSKGSNGIVVRGVQ